jgi:hypothetical protein
MSRHSKPNVTLTKASKGSSLTQEENEDVEFKVSKLEEKITSMETTMEKKVDILNMVSKIEFQNFKDDIKSNMARKDDLKEMARKDDLKEMASKKIKYMEDLMKELTSLLILNSPPQEEDKENKRIKSLVTYGEHFNTSREQED